MKKRKIKKYFKIYWKYFKNNNFNKALNECKKIPDNALSTLGLVKKGICYSEIGKIGRAHV